MVNIPKTDRLGTHIENQPLLLLFTEDGNRKKVDVPIKEILRTLAELPEERKKDIEKSYLAELDYKGPGKLTKDDLFRAALTVWLINWGEKIKPYNTLETMKDHLNGISTSIRADNSMFAGIHRSKIKEQFFPDYTEEEMDKLQFSFFVTQALTSNALTPRKELSWKWTPSIHKNDVNEGPAAITLAKHINREFQEPDSSNTIFSKIVELQKAEHGEMMKSIATHLEEAQKRLDEATDILPPEYWERWISFYENAIASKDTPPGMIASYMEGLARLLIERIGSEIRKANALKPVVPLQSSSELLIQIQTIKTMLDKQFGVA